MKKQGAEGLTGLMDALRRDKVKVCSKSVGTDNDDICGRHHLLGAVIVYQVASPRGYLRPIGSSDDGALASLRFSQCIVS
jgi:hypothetical protein